MSDPLYKKEILRLAADAHGAGYLPQPHVTGKAHNPACGDNVRVDLALDDSGHVTAMAHDTKACVLAQASASILGEKLKGASREDVETLANEIAAMLVTKAAPPASPFESYAVFDGVVPHRNRHRCVLLPIDAVLAAFDESDEG
ncbi:MAG TPA: iron-sulfur cluster assembly scaffold protein [Rhizomicrobium sp.]|jgi:NifU-like protein involved in Fe-S cluster formation|nr:iron-sulfur cluster assembly scaffold protein [Rhizomicrobium sp.]